MSAKKIFHRGIPYAWKSIAVVIAIIKIAWVISIPNPKIGLCGNEQIISNDWTSFYNFIDFLKIIKMTIQANYATKIKKIWTVTFISS